MGSMVARAADGSVRLNVTLSAPGVTPVTAFDAINNQVASGL